MEAAKLETLRILLEQSEMLPPELLSADGWFLRGNAYYLTGHPGKALGCYERALKLQADFPEVRAALEVMAVNHSRTHKPSQDTSG